MFSVKVPVSGIPQSCKKTKALNTGVSPLFYIKTNITLTTNNDVSIENLFYENNTHINNTPSLACLINSTKTVLTHDKYDPTKNPLL